MDDDIVTVTEHVRFNSDGSSDHIKVVGDKLLSVEHFDKSPFILIDTNISWIVNQTKQSKYFYAEHLKDNDNE